MITSAFKELKVLLEARSKSLDRLGDENAIDVLSEFPRESMRLFFRKLEEAGLKLKSKSKQAVLNLIKKDAYGWNPKNNFFNDTFRFDIEEEDSDKEMQFEFYIKENKFYWGIKFRYLSIGYNTNKPIKLASKSLNSIYDVIVDKAVEAKEISNRKGFSLRDEETLKAIKSYGKEGMVTSKIVNKINNILFKKYLFYLRESSYATRGDRDVILSCSAYGDLVFESDENLKKLHFYENNIKNKISYRFQFEELEKYVKALAKILLANNYFLTNIGLAVSEYLYFEAELVSPNKKSRKENFNGDQLELHNYILDLFLKNLKSKNLDSQHNISMEEACRLLFMEAFNQNHKS